MLGLFGTLNLGARSLSAQQEAAAVAGQNLANVNNTAYSRQQVNLSTGTPLPTPVGEEGTGVQIVSITQVRSAILDNQIQAEGSVTGSLNAQQSALQDAEAALGEQLTSSSSSSAAADSPDGLTADLSGLFGSLQSLTTNPSDIPTRQAVIQSAQQLAGQFNQVSSNLATISAGLNSSITSDVAGANQDFADIASLNQQIMDATASGGTANDLVDLRQQTLEDLSGKLNVTTSMEANGSMDVNIGGAGMVVGGTVATGLQTEDAGGGRLMVALSSGPTISITGGSIGGNIEVRDGALATLQTSVNNLASQLITQVNTVYSQGFDLNGNSGQNFFTGSDASNIGVNSALAADPSQFQASGVAGATGDNTVALALAQLANTPVTALGNQTLSQSNAQMVSNLGASLASVNDQVTNSSTVSQMLNTQRQSISGVSTDQEMTNLLQFQKAYQASAELITTINQMMETLITMKTV